MNRKYHKYISLLILGCCLGLLWGTVSPVIAQSTTEPMQIDPEIEAPALAAMMEDTFPDATVLPEIFRTCRSGTYATAGWVWGETGGVLVLQQQQNKGWIVIEGGGGVYSPEELNATFQIPLETARAVLCYD